MDSNPSQEFFDELNKREEAKKVQQNNDAEIGAINKAGIKNVEATNRTTEAVTKGAQAIKEGVRVTNEDLAKSGDVNAAVDAIHKLNLTTFNTNQGLPQLADNLVRLTEAVQSLQKDYEQKGVAGLSKQLTALISKLDGVSKTLSNSKVQVDKGLQDTITNLQKSIDAIEFNPNVNVKAPSTKVVTTPVDFQPVVEALDAVQKAVESNKPQEQDLSPVTQGLEEVRNAISSLTFPVPNYVLPFKDNNGKATQVSLDSSGDVPVSGATLTQIASSVPSNIFRDTFTSQDTTNWTFNNAASDLLYNGGNVASASYLSVCKSALVADSYTEIISNNSWPIQFLVAAGISISQRIGAQAFGYDVCACDSTGNIISSSPVADIALNNAAGAVVSANVVTFTTNSNHGLLPGDTVAIYGCTDPRMNVGESVVTSTPTLTTFTVANTIANATYTVGTSAFVRFQPQDNYATYLMSEYWTSTTATTANIISKNGARQPEIVPSTFGTSAQTIANENGLNYSGLAYTDAIRPTNEFILKLNQKHGQFITRVVDSNAIPAVTVHRSHNIPVQTSNNFKIRLRARNLPNLSVPTGYITVAQKSGSTTATLTVPNHGLTTSDWIVIYGIRDQVNFANQTTVVQVASVVDANNITVVFGASATATSYGGMVMRVQGQATLPALTSSAIQTYALTSDSARLSLVFLATPSTPVVGEVWTLYGLVDSTNTAQSALYGRYKVALFNAATFTVELTPLDSQNISGVSQTPANAGGMMVKNTEFRIHFLRAENESPAMTEVAGSDGNGDFANAIPVQPTNTPNISTVSTVSAVTTLNGVAWGSTNAEPVYYGSGSPNSMDAREQQEMSARINFNTIRNGRWTIT